MPGGSVATPAQGPVSDHPPYGEEVIWRCAARARLRRALDVLYGHNVGAEGWPGKPVGRLKIMTSHQLETRLISTHCWKSQWTTGFSFIFYAKLPTACDVACANVSVRGQHKDVMHEGSLKSWCRHLPPLTNNLTSCWHCCHKPITQVKLSDYVILSVGCYSWLTWTRPICSRSCTL